MNPFLLAQAQSSGFDLSTKIDALARTQLSVILYISLALTIGRLLVHNVLTKTATHKRLGNWTIIKFLDETFDALVYTGIFVFMVLRPFVFQTFTVPSGSMVSTLLVHDYIVANKCIYRYSDPKPGDIVVFRPSAIACFPDQLDERGDPKVDFVKRCIGTPGDVIEVRNMVMYKNGKAMNEPYRHLTRPTNPDMTLYEELTPEEVKATNSTDFKLVKYKGEYMPLMISGDVVNDPMFPIADRYKLSDPEEMRRVKALPAEAVPPGHYLMFGDNRLFSFDSRGWGLVPRAQIVGRSEFIWLPFTRWRRTISQYGTPATN